MADPIIWVTVAIDSESVRQLLEDDYLTAEARSSLEHALKGADETMESIRRSKIENAYRNELDDWAKEPPDWMAA